MSRPVATMWGSILRIGCAIALAVLAAPAGWRPVELAFGAGLVAVALVGARPRVTPRVQVAAIVLLTLLFAASALPLVDPSRPYGTDWMVYLRNAIAIATDDWDHYQRWRGPGHAWASLAAAKIAGGLVEGSILVSFLAATSLVPLTALLGRRVASPEAGILGAALLAGWADLRLYAISSTPYALYAALILAGTVAILGPDGARDGDRAPWTNWLFAGLAGVAFGFAFATDQRAGPVVGIVLLGEAGAALLGGWRARGPAARPGRGRRVRRHLAATAITALVAFAIGAGTLATFPVPLLSVGEQVVLQRDLNAREGVGDCMAKGPVLPTLADLVGPCGRTTLRANLVRGQDAVPVELGMLAGFVLLGLVVVRRGRAALVAPLLPIVPSVLILGVQNRYFVPMAPGLAAAGGAALAWLAGDAVAVGTARRAASVLALAGALAAPAWGWARSPGTTWSRANEGDGFGASPFSGPYAKATAAIREGFEEGDGIIDCAHAGLRERLWPRPVENWSLGGSQAASNPCSRLVAKGTRTPTWVVAQVRASAPVSPTWEVVVTQPAGDGTLQLLRWR